MDSISSTLFITERLAQLLRLPHIHRSLQISGIKGVDTCLSSCNIVCFNVANLIHDTCHMPVEAVVLPKITTELPVHQWKHLKGLHLAEPSFNVPGSTDLLLGADLFAKITHHDRWIGPQEHHLPCKQPLVWWWQEI